MLNNIIIKEIKNFEIYNSNDKLIRHKFSLTGVGLIHNNSSVAKLQGTYHGYASNESIECCTKLYKIKGKAVIQDVDTCGIYEGNFTANHVIFIKNDDSTNELVMILLKIDDEPIYRIDINTNEDEKTLEDNVENFVQGIKRDFFEDIKNGIFHGEIQVTMPESGKLVINETISNLLEKLEREPKLETVEVVEKLIELVQRYKSNPKFDSGIKFI